MNGIRILAIVASVFFVAIVVMTGWQVSRNVKRRQRPAAERAEGTIRAKRQEGNACYLLFVLSDGTERELKADKMLFDAAAEGDAGTLTYQGQMLSHFERKAERT